MNNFKVGDIVIPKDGSYSMRLLSNGEVEESHGSEIIKRNFEIISIECELPAWGSGDSPQINTIIMRALDKNEIIFIQGRMLSLSHRCNCCPSCGKEI